MQREKEAFNALLNNVINLYINGVLVQYGLDEAQALDIIANTTGLSKEKLFELKQARDNRLYQQMSESTDQVLGTFGISNNRRK